MSSDTHIDCSMDHHWQEYVAGFEGQVLDHPEDKE